MCFVVALCLWWIYFDLADTSVVGRGALGLIFVYVHFTLLAGVAAFGEGTKLAVMGATQPGLDAGARWALAGRRGAFAVSLACSTSEPNGPHSPSGGSDHLAATGSTTCRGPSGSDDDSGRPRLVIEQVAFGGEAPGIAGQ
jgi:hypothetical protein